MNELKAAGVELIGVSKDSVQSHDRFKRKHELAFPLASDKAGGVVEAFGTWVEKSMYGKKYMGMERSSFLVDADGTVRKIWRKVKPEAHAAEVLKAAGTLSA